jgi:glyoxylase-like metal-dependent hydrolase (beta-lactamase superfamily II)
MQPLRSVAPPPSELVYPFPDGPPPGHIQQVAPGVYWLRMPLPFVLNHINLWLLDSGDGWTIVDCGFATAEARGAWEQIFVAHLNGKPVTRIIVTHFHPDHIGLCAWLAEKFGITPEMTKAEYLQAHAVRNRIAGTEPEPLRVLMARHGLDAERIKLIDLRDNIYERGVPTLPDAFIRIHGGQTLRIGKHDWRVIIGYGHAPEHAALYCEALGVLISGDMLLPRITTNVSVWPMEPEADPVGEFLASLAKFYALDAHTLVLPSHGLPFRGARVRVDALREHHRVRLERLMEFCREPRNAAEAMPVLFTRKFDDHHLMFAMGEAIAHLNHLMHDGRLRRVENDGIFRFERS